MQKHVNLPYKKADWVYLRLKRYKHHESLYEKNHCIKRYVNSFGSQISIDRLRNQYNEKKLENRIKKDEILKAI